MEACTSHLTSAQVQQCLAALFGEDLPEAQGTRLLQTPLQVHLTKREFLRHWKITQEYWHFNPLTGLDETILFYLLQQLVSDRDFTPKFFAQLMAVFQPHNYDQPVSPELALHEQVIFMFQAYEECQPLPWLALMFKFVLASVIPLQPYSSVKFLDFLAECEALAIDRPYRQSMTATLLCLQSSSLRYISHQFVQQIADNFVAFSLV